MDKFSTSKFKPNSLDAKSLKETDVIIMDEISMVPKHAVEEADRLLQDLMNNKLPFGGKIFIIGGDFRQCLPVKKKATRAEQIALSVRRSYLWKYFKKNLYHLTENKRVLNDQEEFAEFLLNMGNGTLPSDEDNFIQIPDRCIIKPKLVKGKKYSKEDKVDLTRQQLIEEVFGTCIERADFEEMSKRMILASHNDTVIELNNDILDRLQRKGHKLILKYGVDKVDEGDPYQNYVEYPPEFLHSLYGSGLPPYELRLIQGCPVMLVRNLNPAAGLSNGTRLKVVAIHDYILECKILNGDNKGDIVMIPRLKLDSNDEFPFKLSRTQFPVKPCFAMTMNKCQGQTIEYVGLDMTTPVFSHGQCYAAFSRVRGWESIKVAVDPEKGNKVKNIVWKEVLYEDEDSQKPTLATTPKTSRAH